MYQSRGKHARHGGNCANRIINTFRPLHYGCNERFLCTFPCADFAPLFAPTCDRSMHSRAKIRIQGNDSSRLKRLMCTSFMSVIVKNYLYISINFQERINDNLIIFVEFYLFGYMLYSVYLISRVFPLLLRFQYVNSMEREEFSICCELDTRISNSCENNARTTKPCSLFMN